MGNRHDLTHCRPDFSKWEQLATCCHCGKPLADNQRVKDVYTTNNVNAWAKMRLNVLADMLDSRDQAFIATELRKVAGGLLLIDMNDD
jgi:hypothetical protein